MIERPDYNPLVERARNFHWGDGGLIRSEDWEGWFKLHKIDKARYLGARDNCDVVESLAGNPKYGPEYQIKRYGSVNFWYRFLQKEMTGIKKFESFGAQINLTSFGGLGNYDKVWVPAKNINLVRGPATYHAYTLPRQIIDIINLSEKASKKNKDYVSRQSLEAVNSVLTSPNLDAAVLRLVVQSKQLGLSLENIRERVFDGDYKKELPEGYWKPIFERVESLLESKGL